MTRRLIGATFGAVLLVGMAGVLVAAETGGSGPALIAGDKPVTEDQVRQKLQSEGYSDLQVVRQGKYIEAMGSKDGQSTKVIVDSQTGRLAGDDARWHSNDDDDD